ncbi:MAG: hypothetical protein M3Y59_12505 [Myxococcota bacterium]|nr:hypothetical protein [Myxococcota bacterium]
MAPSPSRPSSAAAVRDHLIAALEADLVGPFGGPAEPVTSTEELELPPSRWYLTGFLVPQEGEPETTPEDDDQELAADGADDEERQDSGPCRKGAVVVRRRSGPAALRRVPLPKRVHG